MDNTGTGAVIFVSSARYTHSTPALSSVTLFLRFLFVFPLSPLCLTVHIRARTRLRLTAIRGNAAIKDELGTVEQPPLAPLRGMQLGSRPPTPPPLMGYKDNAGL